VVFFAPEIGVIDLYENIQDPASEKSCIVWRYWNPELIDKNLDGGGCPEYYTQEFSSTWKFGLISGLLFAVPYLATKHFRGTAKRACKRRGAALEKFLPYAASYTAAMAASNATPMKIFRSLAQNEEIYGDIAYDAAMIYRDITLLGMDLVTAIKLAVDRSASQWGTDFFQGMVGTLSSGGDLKLYFLNRAEHYMRENRIRLTIFLETLAMLAESYVVVAVAMPLFLMVMLVIMFWVSGSGSQMDESFLYLIVMGMLPAIHIAYCGLIWMMSEEQKM
jgi:archaellum biogenesis protein FlaJ (TadC family)